MTDSLIALRRRARWRRAASERDQLRRVIIWRKAIDRRRGINLIEDAWTHRYINEAHERRDLTLDACHKIRSGERGADRVTDQLSCLHHAND